jgi:hypothetical protein
MCSTVCIVESSTGSGIGTVVGGRQDVSIYVYLNDRHSCELNRNDTGVSYYSID